MDREQEIQRWISTLVTSNTERAIWREAIRHTVADFKRNGWTQSATELEKILDTLLQLLDTIDEVKQGAQDESQGRRHSPQSAG